MKRALPSIRGEGRQRLTASAGPVPWWSLLFLFSFFFRPVEGTENCAKTRKSLTLLFRALLVTCPNPSDMGIRHRHRHRPLPLPPPHSHRRAPTCPLTDFHLRRPPRPLPPTPSPRLLPHPLPLPTLEPSPLPTRSPTRYTNTPPRGITTITLGRRRLEERRVVPSRSRPSVSSRRRRRRLLPMPPCPTRWPNDRPRRQLTRIARRWASCLAGRLAAAAAAEEPSPPPWLLGTRRVPSSLRRHPHRHPRRKPPLRLPSEPRLTGRSGRERVPGG
jgi:hypothetical protein